MTKGPGERAAEVEGRSCRPGTARVGRAPRSRKEAQEGSPLEASGEAGACCAFLSDMQPPDSSVENECLFLSVPWVGVIGHSSTGRPTPGC